MILFKNAFFTVWHVDEIKDKYARVRVGTSEKDQQNEGEYINSNWFSTFVGDARVNVESLNAKDKITASGKISNVSKKQEDGTYKTYLNLVIWDFVKSDGVPSTKEKTPRTTKEDPADINPFA